MNMIRKLDDYFLGTDEADISDRIWFYGTYAIVITITIGIGASLL